MNQWKILLSVVLMLSFVGVAGFADEKPAKTVAYYRVNLTGEVSVTHLHPELAVEDARSGMNACQADTKLELEFWYPMVGGGAKAQTCTVRLVSYDCPPYGNAVDCEEQPLPAAYEPREFKMESALARKAGKKDTIRLLLPEVPALDPIIVRITCHGGTPGDMSDYGTTFNQVYTALNQNPQNLPVALDQTRAHVSRIKVFGLFRVRIAWTVKATLHKVADIID